MKRGFVTASLVLSIAALGCVSRGEHQRLRTQLEECRSDKVSAQAAATACEDRYAQEVRQWENMETVMSDVIPQTLREFRSERDEIVELVPEQARQEVQRYLDEFAEGMTRGFQVMKEDSDRILMELDRNKTLLDEVGVRTSSIDERVTSTLQDAFNSRDRLTAVRNEMIESASALVDEIHEFDRTYIGEKASPDRLKLNRKQREAIQLFHDHLVSQLAALGRVSAETP